MFLLSPPVAARKKNCHPSQRGLRTFWGDGSALKEPLSVDKWHLHPVAGPKQTQCRQRLQPPKFLVGLRVSGRRDRPEPPRAPPKINTITRCWPRNQCMSPGCWRLFRHLGFPKLTLKHLPYGSNLHAHRQRNG